MRPFFLAFLALVPLSLPVVGQGIVGAFGAPADPLRALHTADDARAWEAVGRLDSGVSFCTATLIAADLVLTAAHCLFTSDGQRLPDAELSFSAGLRHGRAEAVRGVAQSIVPRGYTRPPGRADLASIERDIALLRLDRPVDASNVRPIPTGARPFRRSAVTLVSYGADREAFPSIEENCLILSQEGAVQVLSCHVVAGSSGAPVIHLGPNGPEIVAIVSGRADLDHDEVTVAVATDPVLADLAALPFNTAGSAAPPRLSQGGSIVIRRVGEGEGDASREGFGARFMRP